MKPLFGIFGQGQKKEKRRSSTIQGLTKAPFAEPDKEELAEKPIDEKSTSFFRSQDLSRARFSYEILSETSWWPDEILLFLEILHVAYTDFINTYLANGSMFDLPIKKATYFMFLGCYQKYSDISRYVSQGDYRINDSYLNQVVHEDNCYMYELESRPRSINEGKHFLLTQALEKLMSLAPISEGDQLLGKENEQVVSIFLCVYNLRTIYCTTDSLLRSHLVSLLKGRSPIGGSLILYFRDILEDIEGKLLSQMKLYYDATLFNNICIFRDLILFARYATAQFHHVFSFKRQFDENVGRLSPLTYTEESMKRIEHIYHYHAARVARNKAVSEVIAADKSVISSVAEKDQESTAVKTPRYSRGRESVKPTSLEADTFYLINLDDFEPAKSPRVKEGRDRKKSSHIRKVSIAGRESIIHAREDTVHSLSEVSKELPSTKIEN